MKGKEEKLGKEEYSAQIISEWSEKKICRDIISDQSDQSRSGWSRLDQEECNKEIIVQ